MTKYITRFAPSPTGYFHLGSARTALINFIISKKNKESKFILRIEDTDKERSHNEYIKNITDSLKWLGINWDSRIQIQSKNINRHREVADFLLKNQYAYKCSCTIKILNERRKEIISNKTESKKICKNCKDDEKVQSLKSNFTIRINIPLEGNTVINDKIQGKISVKNKELDDFILLRNDGSPTYMLSAVVDDNDSGVNFIIRGDDHFNNTFRQKYIYEYMKWNIPEYGHIPLIHGEDGTKLSKRHGAINIIDLKKSGYLPESIINNLILLGWSPNQNETEIINLNQIIEKFDIRKLSKSSSIFSYEKLNFFNNNNLKKEENLKLFINYCKTNTEINVLYNEDPEKLTKIFQAYKKNIHYYSELIDIANTYFNKNYKLILNETFDEKFQNEYNEFRRRLELINDWSLENINKFFEAFLKEKSIKFSMFGKPLRYILTNSYDGPSIIDIMIILGKNDSIERLNQYITKN